MQLQRCLPARAGVTDGTILPPAALCALPRLRAAALHPPKLPKVYQHADVTTQRRLASCSAVLTKKAAGSRGMTSMQPQPWSCVTVDIASYVIMRHAKPVARGVRTARSCSAGKRAAPLHALLRHQFVISLPYNVSFRCYLKVTSTLRRKLTRYSTRYISLFVLATAAAVKLWRRGRASASPPKRLLTCHKYASWYIYHFLCLEILACCKFRHQRMRAAASPYCAASQLPCAACASPSQPQPTAWQDGAQPEVQAGRQRRQEDFPARQRPSRWVRRRRRRAGLRPVAG